MIGLGYVGLPLVLRFSEAGFKTIGFDIDKEKERLQNQINDMTGRLNAVNGKLNNENFVGRAPEEVVKHEREKHSKYSSALEKLEENLSYNYSIRSASDKQNSFIRIIEMLSLVFLYRKICKLIIVDVFGTKAFYFSCLVILLARVYKLPVLPVFRGGSLPERFNKCPTLFELIFQKNQLVICPSSYLSIFFENKGISTHIIPNYINIEKYPFQNRKDIAPNLFWVRSLHSIYNPEMAIKVLFELCKKYPHARLCLVGPHKDDSINKIDEFANIFKG